MISPEELDRIVNVEHTDPHAVLGPHFEGGAFVVRVFRPEALEVRILTEGGAGRPTKCVHGAGIFEATFPGISQPFAYRLEVRYPRSTVLLHDPYAFPPVLGALDLHLAAEGTHLEIYRKLGAHVRDVRGVSGTSFSVWAPSAQRVSVVGDFNGWDGRVHAMRRLGNGIWELFVPGVGDGALYKFEIKTLQGPLVMKSDPYGRAMELRPRTASKVAVRRYEFRDHAWMAARPKMDARRRPISIYEAHLGSWRIRSAKDTAAPADPAERWFSYRELADKLLDYVVDMGFTHIELLPVTEHPYDGSWGYQTSGYFAPTSRYGDPDGLRYFIDRCHEREIGVILDWTPAHFPKDAFALGRFDGSALYEHLDPRQGEHRQWQTFVFNYGRPEVKNFLISSALYWFDEFHADGLRVDAVASMLYLDYGASHPGEWVPNKFGGRENLEAIAFLRELNERVHALFPGALIVAEESTAWPSVTRPTYVGGLGFDLKWNMGWMHDTLGYFGFDPIHRTFHHGKLTFSLMYAFAERFLLPLSHDEVVHLKKSLYGKMPGDRWKKLANLRALYAYMWSHPGKKLLFMGGEIAQKTEWAFESELDWEVLDEKADRDEEPPHLGVQRLVRDLNTLYKKMPALHEMEHDSAGFLWIDCNDALQSVVSFVRFPLVAAQGKKGKLLVDQPLPKEPVPGLPGKGVHLVCVGNFTPIPRVGYRIGVPRLCRYVEVLNTDAKVYGGSGMGNFGEAAIERVPAHGFEQSIVLTLPPLSMIWLAPELDMDPPEQWIEEPVVIKPDEQVAVTLTVITKPASILVTSEDREEVSSLAPTPRSIGENDETLVIPAVPSPNAATRVEESRPESEGEGSTLKSRTS